MRETAIHWMNDEKCADVFTCDTRLIAQIEGNGGKPIAEYRDGSKEYRVPVELVQIAK